MSNYRQKAPDSNASLQQWLGYIGKIHPVNIDLGLERVRKVAQRLNLLTFNSAVITIAGTNGKGSCVKILESICLKAGYSVAATTSPHLIRFNERLRICGQEVSDYLLLQAFAAIEEARQTTSLSYFEFTSLAILYCIREVETDVILLEVGLGGRLDAMNIIDADIAVISNIDLDHMDYLGDTREQIGFEKAGIFRANKLAVCGDPNPPHSIAQAATEVGAKLFCLNKEFSYQLNQENWNFCGPLVKYSDLPMPRLKIENVATSLAVVQLLAQKLPLDQQCFNDVIRTVGLAGRFEVLHEPRHCVLDVAHNPQAVRWLLRQLQDLQITSRVHLVIGMLKDKNISECLSILAPLVEDWYVASLADSRGADATYIKQQLQALQINNCYTFNCVAEAFEKARARRGSDDWIVVCGSFHTVGAVKQRLQQYQEELP